jgi:pimeloyl-ACP methyl ester carboxylesterase
VFVSHGVLGGHDNIRELVDLWFGREFRAIGPSRFGYLGSAMPPHATVADQADVYAALLDHLGVERVVLCGFSAGGPAVIQFALRHAERLDGLILGSNYCRAWVHDRSLSGFCHSFAASLGGSGDGGF